MAIGGIGALVAILGVIAGTLLAVMIFLYVLVPVLKGFGWIVGKFFWLIGAGIAHVFRYIAGTLRDTFRAVGAVPAAVIFAFLAVGSVVVGRWSASAHFASNMQKEVKNFVACIYRVGVGHPLRLVGLHAMLEGIEQRVPAAMAEIPGADKPNRRTGKFEGYEIVGSLPGGGSGGRLYIATPNIEKRGKIAKANGDCPERVVIKSFAVADGSSIPQIVRESRALESAKLLGLILDHELDETRFHYVMPYVPGESLGTMTRDLHTKAGNGGLRENEVRQVLGYLGDVLTTLDTYHRGGLWHKDIKPENIIVSEDDRAHVVEILGLVTPLRSAMTLTTHGTEYFRDPEMVRMALKGVKVNEVDGTKFDLYAAGAVLFYVLENTFPSHGGLSTISKPCPDAVKWIVRRAMTDYSKRYESAAEMYEDIKAVATHPRMASMKPVDLPSLSGGGVASSIDQDLHAAAEPPPPAAHFAVHTPGNQGAASHAGDQDWDKINADFTQQEGAGAGPWNRRPERKRRKFKVVNWWTGSYEPADGEPDSENNMRDEIRRAKNEVRSAVKVAAAEARVAARRARDEVRKHRCGRSAAAAAACVGPAAGSPRPQNAADGAPIPASAQVARARGRASELRRRARERVANRKVRAPGEKVSVGMIMASAFVGCVVLMAIGGATLLVSAQGGPTTITYNGLSGVPSPSQGTTFTESRVLQNDSGRIVESWSRGDFAGLSELPEQLDEFIGDLSIVDLQSLGLREAYQIHWPEEYPTGVIIVNDHPQPGNDKVKNTINEISTAVGAIGLEQTFGDGKEALIRARVGQFMSGPYAVAPGANLNAAEIALDELMRESLDTIGCIVWLYPVADEPDEVRLWVITPNSVESELDNNVLSYLEDATR